MKLSDRYYTGREVQKILGITEPSLRNLVNQKKIRKVVPPGRKNGLYLKTEIDAFAEKWEAFLLAEEPPEITFKIAEPDDMEAENELDKRTVGGAGMTSEVRKAWLLVNPETDYHVKYGDRLVAFLRLVPLKENILQDFMVGKIRGRDIKPEDIETFEPGKPVSFLVIGISRDPEVDDGTRAAYMLALLRGAAQELKKLGQRGILINKIYATSESPTGIAMALHAGMQELPPRLGKRLRLELEPDKSPTLIARYYQEGLAEWKKKHEQRPKTSRKNRMSPNSNQTKTPV